MLERETLMAELWSRIRSTPGVVYTARNPSQVPSAEQLPAIQMFEMPDTVEKQDSRGGLPIYHRSLIVVVESFINATSEPAASKEITAFVDQVKKVIYSGGPTLGGKAKLIRETEASRVLRPKMGENIVGLGIVFAIQYIENVANIT